MPVMRYGELTSWSCVDIDIRTRANALDGWARVVSVSLVAAPRGPRRFGAHVMDLVTMSPPMPGFPATFEGVYCRLAPDAHVSVSDELSVMVYNRHATVVSLAEGFVDFEDDFGNHYSAHTAGLYLAAAEAQGIEVQTVPRHIDPLTGDFIYPV